MKRVTGIGGIFFQAKDPQQTREWYQQHLGIESEAWGAVFNWREHDNPAQTGTTAWSVMREGTPHFQPGQQEFMVNYRVADLDALLVALKAEGVAQIGETDVHEYGKFAWILDPDGRKVELWEPVNAPSQDA
jgi:predicted enzyme related to lactoylglutathione lyase